MHDHTTVESPPLARAPKSRRLASLDLLRGLTVIGMMVANSMAGFSHDDGPVFAWLLHSHWAGFTIADSIFPAFIVMVGVAVGLGAKAGRPDVRRILGRTARLILLGLFLSNLFWFWDAQENPLRIPGVLQRIGIAYAAAALLCPVTTWRGRAAIAGGLLLLYWPLCLLPSPDGMPTDLWVQGHNFVSWSDRAMLGPLRYVGGADGYDPEGLLGSLPAIAEALIGTLIGDYLRRGQPIGRASGRMALAALAMIGAGGVWGLAFPIAKNLWTSSFVLVSAGIALLVLAGFHRVFDGRDAPARRGGLLGSFGRNAIATYTLHELTSFILAADAFQWVDHRLAPVLGTQLAALGPTAIYIALVWWPISALDRRGWYLAL